MQSRVNNNLNNSRRQFLRGMGQLVMGFAIIPTAINEVFAEEDITRTVLYPFKSSQRPEIVDSWIRLQSDGNVTVLTGKMELGQGIRTALMQMAAEELDVALNRISIITADTAQTVNERYTAGSASIESSGRSIRNAAAEARQVLLEMAATKLSTPISELTVTDGLIKSGNGKSVTYWQLLEGKNIEGKITGKAPTKSPSKFTIVGTSQPRIDIIAMATGRPVFVHDIRFPNMLHARVLRPPVYRATLVSMDSNALKKIEGDVKVVKKGSFVAVLAEKEFQAVKALRALEKACKWDSKPLEPSFSNLYSDMKATADSEVVAKGGMVSSAITTATTIFEAEYTKPYHMHGSVGPSCAVAEYKDDQLTVWSPTQGVFPLRQTISDMVGISEEKIRIIGVPGSGCYGHNGADDVSADAALLAIEMKGRPVRVQWMREDEHRWEPYGSAMAITIKAGLDKNKDIVAWQSQIWSDTHSTRPGGKAGHFIAARDLDTPFNFNPGGFSGGSYRNAEPLYKTGSREIKLFNYRGPLRTSALRSLGAYGNIFALESFMDELAEKAGEDVIEFRLKHLADERAKKVIREVVTKTKFGQKMLAGYGQGFAFAQYKNSAAYFAVVAEVVVDVSKKSLILKKLTGCIDAGQIINPDGISNQTSGGMIQSASWTLLEEVKYNETGITSTGWNSYPIFRFKDVPETEVILIDRPNENPLGAGEAAQAPTAAAIVNAIYNATGTRIRNLPATPGKIDWSLVMKWSKNRRNL